MSASTHCPRGSTTVVADRCRKPWRKLTELSRRARQLDAAVVRAEQQGQFDLVLSNLHKTDRIVARSRALRERNVWFCLHGVFSASYLGHRTGFDRWMKQQKIKRIYQGRNVVTVSDAVGRDLVEEFALRPAQLKTIYNPFDITALRAEAEADSERPDGDYLIHVGRFHPGKRHDRLLEAYAQSGIDAPLVLLGRGKPEQEQRLRQLAKTLHIDDRVWFKGFQKNPLPWIKGARMLVLSPIAKDSAMWWWRRCCYILLSPAPAAPAASPRSSPANLPAVWRISPVRLWLRRCKAFTITRRPSTMPRWKNSASYPFVSSTVSCSAPDAVS